MEAVTSIFTLVASNIYFTKNDLKNAYNTVPILDEHQKYLKSDDSIIYTNLPAYLMVIVMGNKIS